MTRLPLDSATESEQVSPAKATGFTIRVFGATGFDDGVGPVSIGGHRQRRLLALLAIRTGSVVTIDWLAEHLWNDLERPDAPEPALRTYLSRLRRALPEYARDCIATETGGYRLDAPAESVEHLQFGLLRAAAARARNDDDPLTAKRKLDEALALWRGDPFRELEDLDWAQGDVERLRQDRLEVLEEGWEVSLALGRHTQITGELAAFTTEHSLRDRAARQYALALHRSGRTTEALRVLSKHRGELAGQSGLEPSLELQQLENALLSNDPTLEVQKLGRPLRGYRLIDEVGSGAFSIVWRGMQPSVGREVAIKQIRSELASQPAFIRRFEAEAYLVARLEHPHIVPLIDFWRDPDSAYLVMRWLAGGTLERRLDDGPLTLDQTTTLAVQIGGALATAHAQGVVHRDVKTANIMFDNQDNAFLTDFGIALPATESAGPEAALSPGTPAYASPEQIRRELLGPQADIFSLGVILHECLTGTLPNTTETTEEPLVENQAGIPKSVFKALAKATAADPAERFETVDEFVNAFAYGPRSLLGLGTPTEDASPALEQLVNPYKGLHAFSEGDGAAFFGRDRLVTELVQRLGGTSVSSRCVVLVGPSGSGKSSVARAGLMPAIRGGAVSGSEDWFTTTMVPGFDPYESMEAALLRIAVNPPSSLSDQLRDGKRGILRSIRRCVGSDNDRVAIVVDQFEELFTGPSAVAANDFLDALAVAVEDPASPLRLIITIRADYYDRPLEHRDFAPIVKACAVEVTPLAADELEQAIVEPARDVGVEFETGLVSRLTAETIGQPSPLPLLQYVLSELFNRRDGLLLTNDSYHEIGGLTGALASRAEALFATASSSQQAAIRTVFGRLTSASEQSTDLRRRVLLSDLGDDPSAAWVIEKFGEARLLSFDRDIASREPIVEVAHEALLREWPRLAGWLEEDADLLRSAGAISAAADIWVDGSRAKADLYRDARLASAIEISISAPERLRTVDHEFVEASRRSAEASRHVEDQRVRRLRRLVAGTAAALVIALGAAGLAYRQSQSAEEQRQAAEASAALAQTQTDAALVAAEQADLATIVSRSGIQSAENPELALLLALEAHRRQPGTETSQAVLNALGASAIGARIASNEPLVDPDGMCGETLTNTEGTREFGVADGQLISRDPLTGGVSEHGPAPAACVTWMQDTSLNRRIAVAEDGLRMWLGPVDGPWDVEREFAEQTALVSTKFTLSNRLTVRLTRATVVGSPVVMLIDTETGETVGPEISDGFGYTSATENSDGSLFAMAFGFDGRAEGDGVTIVVDGETGAEQFRVDTRLLIDAVVFDDRTGELILGSSGDGSIITVDVSTGQVVAEVSASSAGGFVNGGLAVRSDGLVLATSQAEIELIDRHSGPTGVSVDLNEAVLARARPDATVLVGTDDTGSAIFDLDGGALVMTSWPIEPFSQVEIHDGFAAIVKIPAGTPEIINLASGDRSSVTLTSPNGDPHLPVVAYHTDGGVWTVDPNSSAKAFKWIDGEQVQSIRFDHPPWTGSRSGNLWAIALGGSAAGYEEAVVIDLAADTPRVQLTVPASFNAGLYPSLDGGLHLIDRRGRLRTYDSAGVRTSEVLIPAADWTALQTPLHDALSNAMTVDSTTGMLAVTGTKGEVLLVDTDAGTIEELPGIDPVHHLGFVGDGRLLAIMTRDGSITLWDVERGASVGQIWQGSGAGSHGSTLWYDDTTESLWAATSGRLLQIPMNPDVWIERACEVVGRDFTQDEWDKNVPGDQPINSACS